MSKPRARLWRFCEALALQVHDLDFAASAVLVRDGKEYNDRRVPRRPRPRWTCGTTWPPSAGGSRQT